MRTRWRLAAGVAVLAVQAVALGQVRAATAPPPHPAPVATARPVAAATAHPVPAPVATTHARPHLSAHPAVPAAAPTAVPVPVHAPGDASSAGRRRLLTINSIDEGFLLALPGAGYHGPIGYIPPQPRSQGDDAGSLLLAGIGGLLVAIGAGAVALFLLLRPRPVPMVRASVALAPVQRRNARAASRCPARLSQDAFDRLPPLLQLAILDRARPSAELAEEAVMPVPPAG